MAGIRTGGQAPVRLYALDAVRITAALVVVLYHYVALGTAWGLSGTQHLFPALRPFALYGWLGVEIFFIVSGFVICMSAWGRTVGDFATSRISRLFPAYWAASPSRYSWCGSCPRCGAWVDGPTFWSISRCSRKGWGFRTSTTRTGPFSRS